MNRFLQQVGPSGIAGPLILSAIGLGAFLAGSSGKPLPPAYDPWADLPLQSFDTPVLMPELHAEATPATTAVSFARLPALHVWNLNNHDEAWLRPYLLDGSFEPESLATLTRILGDVSKPDEPLYTDMDVRPIQLMVRAAYHFHAREVVIVSGYRASRRRREGLHGRGLAIDFQLPGVRLATLAEYVQSLPRVGVGLYTNPNTQWIHLDSRAKSYHWADSSGPGSTGGAWPIGDPIQRARTDARFVPAEDWPEGTVVAPSVVERRRYKLASSPKDADER